jgi:hypothetical protein
MAGIVAFLLGLAGGAALGAIGMAAWLRPKLAARAAAARDVPAPPDEAAAQIRLSEMQAQLSMLRHDLHGILSPALLTADRLTSSADPAIRKAGDIVVRTVERATARLAATKEK